MCRPACVVGILADLAGAIAAADIALLALSTFDTDILLVPRATWPLPPLRLS